MADAVVILNAAAGRKGHEYPTVYVSRREKRKPPRTPRRKPPPT
ncbi:MULTISPECIES: hypothetical protein [unclassified Variovorax]|nr:MULTISPECIES: hypothetical protein [unclassified Variovorax]